VASTRDRIIDAAAELFRRHGYTGTGLKQISQQSGAPLGSLYHFFPGGKEQMTAETLRWSGHGYQVLVEAVFDDAPDVLTGVRDCFAGAAEVLRLTDYADACPIETVALEVASTNEALRQVTAEVFEAWITAATVRLAAAGVTEATARQLGIGLICALEGAFVLSRALKSTEPMEAAGRAVADAIRVAMAASNPTPKLA
jgi:AcrR family transcriptional regulator